MKANQILMTTNYDIFKIYEKNRKIKEGKVTRLMASIRKIDMTAERPIIINENMEIVDGQHRLEACKRLKLPIYYIKKTLHRQMDAAITQLNDVQAQWTLSDYIDHYVKRGYSDYQLILDCQEKYNVTTSTAINFVANSINSGSIVIRSGKFKAGPIKFETFGDILMDFKNIFRDYNHVFFIRALVFAVTSKKYNHKLDFKRFEKNRYSLKGCANIEQYLMMFEETLNSYRHGEKIKLMAAYASKNDKANK